MTRRCSLLLSLCLTLNACEDAPSNGTLCSEERDPHGFVCDPSAQRIDSTRALALLREAYPGAQIYVMDSDRVAGTLNVDGEDHYWSFWLTDENGVWLIASVTASGDVDADELVDARCDGAPFEPLDSRRAVRQAIAAFEAEVGIFVHGNLFLNQNVCGHQPLPETHHVRLFPRTDDAGFGGEYYARFRHDRSFIDLVGPCQGSLDECLAGVVVEPEP